MNDHALCRVITDKMIDGAPLTPEESRHAHECGHCRGLPNKVDRLRHRGTMLPPAPVSLQKRIQGHIETLAASAGTIPTSPVQSAWPTWNWLLKPAWGAMFVVLILTSITVFHGVRSTWPPAGEPGFTLGLPGSAPAFHPFNRPVTLRNGQGFARFSSGIHLQFSGIQHPVITPSGCRITDGSVAIEIPPGMAGFRVDTPHGNVTVTGTIFRVTVLQDRTEVQVSRGSVRLNPLGGTRRNLVAGQSGDMLPWLDKPVSASGASFIPPSADADVDGQSK